MRTSRTAFTAAAALTLSTLLTSCTGGGEAYVPPVPDASQSTVEPPPQEPLTAPEADLGEKGVLAEGPRRGPWKGATTTNLPKGELRITVHCLSQSKPTDLTVTVDNGGFDVRCSNLHQTIIMNGWGATSAGKFRLTVATEETVRWYISARVSPR
ncbi:hypothetical protein [Streptomyces sp. McG8]|uniref:hypothetical protein n=1 Tax=Streptomyces sp. McG8 TaxID=2725487 RepID=UPI001BEB9D99|nr:hypothetical protein [Streptomyces sp. McG8]